MRRNGNYPEELLAGLPSGFAGELALLRYEYVKRHGLVTAALARFAAAGAGFDGAARWLAGLREDGETFLAGLDACAEKAAELGRLADEGRLSLENARVCAGVVEAQEEILRGLTALQQTNSASLSRVFELELPSRLRELPADERDALRAAIRAQADDTQFISNELQDLAIFLKERNKVITHPLDEYHPE